MRTKYLRHAPHLPSWVGWVNFLEFVTPKQNYETVVALVLANRVQPPFSIIDLGKFVFYSDFPYRYETMYGDTSEHVFDEKKSLKKF